MAKPTITIQDQSDIKKYFGYSIEELELENFQKLRKQLRAKYHPDNFEKFEDETIREMATERFQRIEDLSEKITAYLNNTATKILSSSSETDLFHKNARFVAKKLKFEIRTSNKDLKYKLFGKRNYKWLAYGETFHIPNTTTAIVMDENHQGNRIGYQETIRIYLTFGEEQVTEDVANWIYEKIKDHAETLLISGQKVSIDPYQILLAIRQETFLRIAESV